jgi:hypothetical protein
VRESRANLHHNEPYLAVVQIAIVHILIVPIKLVKIHGIILED